MDTEPTILHVQYSTSTYCGERWLVWTIVRPVPGLASRLTSPTYIYKCPCAPRGRWFYLRCCQSTSSRLPRGLSPARVGIPSNHAHQILRPRCRCCGGSLLQSRSRRASSQGAVWQQLPEPAARGCREGGFPVCLGWLLQIRLPP